MRSTMKRAKRGGSFDSSDQMSTGSEILVTQTIDGSANQGSPPVLARRTLTGQTEKSHGVGNADATQASSSTPQDGDDDDGALVVEKEYLRLQHFCAWYDHRGLEPMRPPDGTVLTRRGRKPHPAADAREKEEASRVLARAEAEACFTRNMAKCKCEPRCHMPDALDWAIAHRALTEERRLSIVRSILSAIAAPPGRYNALLETHGPSAPARTTVAYCFRGTRLCKAAFCAIMQVSDVTVKHLTRDLALRIDAEKVESKRGTSSLGRQTLRVRAAVDFILGYAAFFGEPCSSARGSSPGAPIIHLPRETTKMALHKVYKQAFPLWVTVFKHHNDVSAPVTQLSLQGFGRVWREHVPQVRVLATGSDFCDFCTMAREASKSPNVRPELLQELDRHITQAKARRSIYNALRASALLPDCDFTHLTIDFAQHYLLPSFNREPARIFYVTGLKVDIFGVCVSNTHVNTVYPLVEGRWPGKKDSNCTVSLLNHTLCTAVPPHRKLHLSADNAASQNKNRNMVRYCALLVLLERYDEVTLHFLLRGHTKNVCDAQFGVLKRAVNREGALTPPELEERIRTCTRGYTACGKTDEVAFVDWGEMFDRFFVKVVPGVSEYHTFSFSAAFPGSVMVQDGDGPGSLVHLLKPDVDPAYVLSTYPSLHPTPLPITPLNQLPSPDRGSANREDYLRKNLDRHFPNNPNFFHNLFGSTPGPS